MLWPGEGKSFNMEMCFTGFFPSNEPDEEQIVPVKYIRPRPGTKYHFDDRKSR